MPNTTLTINHADGGSETYTINRDKFEGIRNMTRKLDETAGDPENITGFTLSGPTDFSTSNGSFTKQGDYWRSANNSFLRIRLSSGTWEIVDSDEGDTYWTSSEGTTYPWEVTTWTVGVDGSGSQPTFGSFVGGSLGSVVTDTVIVDHTPQEDIRNLLIDAQNITINRDKGEEIRTLFIDGVEVTIDRTGEVVVQSFLDLFTGAAAAYSLQQLGDSQELINVRRASDGVEIDVYPDSSTNKEVSASSPITVNSGSSTATTFGEFLTEATPARNRTGGARYDTFTPDGVTGFTAITNNVAAGGFDIAGSSGTAVEVSFDITLNSGSVDVKLRPEFESGGDVSNTETITTSGSKSFTLTSTADFKAMLFITASADFVVSNFSVNVPYNHTATVTTWYDQSGNGNDATQTLDDAQPKIAEGGSLLTGGIDFDGVDDFLETNNSDLSNVTELSLFTILTPFTGALQKVAVSAGSTVSNSTAYGGWNLNFNGFTDTVSLQTQSQGSTPTSGAASSVTANESVITSILNIPNGTTSVNSTEGTTNTSMVAPLNDSPSKRKLRIGCQFTFQISRNYQGTIKEVILYDSDQSANRTAIEANINERYSIY